MMKRIIASSKGLSKSSFFPHLSTKYFAEKFTTTHRREEILFFTMENKFAVKPSSEFRLKHEMLQKISDKDNKVENSIILFGSPLTRDSFHY